MKFLLFLLWLSFTLGYLPKCYKYKKSDTLEKNICADKKNSNPVDNYEINLKLCKYPMICNIITDSFPNYCINPQKRYPGEYCDNNENCLSKICRDHRCKGKNKDDVCEDDSECDAGMFCKIKRGTYVRRCAPVFEEGENCFAFTDKCAPYLACDAGICKQMGSLPVGAPSTNNLVCQTNFIEFGVCAKGYKLIDRDGTKGPFECHNECKYENGNGDHLIKDCNCGMTDKGTAYCKVLEGDLDFTDVNLKN